MERIDLLRLAGEKVIVLDGAMGTSLQRYKLNIDDFRGLEGCNDILVETRPDVVKEIHAGYLDAGCDVIETNTFGTNGIVLAEYGMAERTLELNRTGAAVAREVAEDFSSPDRPRYVLGSVGPGTKLPSLGQVSFDELRAAFVPQFRGLMQGGADAVCIETCQDLLQTRAAIFAAREAFSAEGRRVPVFVSVTIESNGTMLVGSDIQTAIASLWPMGIDVLGVNCATGPAEMKRHIARLSRFGPQRLMAMPNAGLPENVDGNIVYTLTPERFADWLEGFVREDGVGIVGGCCGTTAAHLAELVSRVGSLPAPVRDVSRPAELASLYQAVPMRQVPPPLMIGERTNATGSKQFRSMLLDDDLAGMLAVAREQERGGAHTLDVSVAYAGRSEADDMTRFLSDLVRTARLPITIDSTNQGVIERALKLCGGRSSINSINLEEGLEKLDAVASLARDFGAAVIALAIDETGMAMTAEHKLEVAERIFARCTEEHGLGPQDLVFDMLTFTVASGDSSTRTAAVETLKAVEEFKKRHPDVLTVLGVSNVSFGLRPAARRVLNSVFLSLAVERGLDQAIVNARGIIPLYRIADQLREAATRLLLNDRSGGDPLTAYMELFDKEGPAGKGGSKAAARGPDLLPEQAVRRMVVDGVSKGMDALLDRLVEQGLAPEKIINTILISAMKEVGQLFGSGRMQLPFVLQSAETMRAAVNYLERFFVESSGRELGGAGGVLVLGTVKGDVHDIGKNLVDIIISNNGFRVVNLGTRLEIEEILNAAREHEADAVGMSGLLVKSTIVMKENLEEMRRRGWTIPVLLGGAALTRDFVEGELARAYRAPVFYCRDAFDGLNAMNEIVGNTAPGTRAVAAGPAERGGPERTGTDSGGRCEPAGTTAPVPKPPFFGTRLVKDIPLDDVFSMVNETRLFKGQWRFRRGKMSSEEYEELTETEVRPLLALLKEQCIEDRLIRPRAVRGYFHCFSRNDSLVILDRGGEEQSLFHFPRIPDAAHPCIADWFHPEDSGIPDVIGMFVVTVGQSVVDESARLYSKNRYRDYLLLHGLAVECAEATAEWMHKRMRRELKLGKEAGPRFSFGYPACPDLDSQTILFDLLTPGRIGVTLSKGMQMVPEHSVSAIIVHAIGRS